MSFRSFDTINATFHVFSATPYVTCVYSLHDFQISETYTAQDGIDCISQPQLDQNL